MILRLLSVRRSCPVMALLLAPLWAPRGGDCHLHGTEPGDTSALAGHSGDLPCRKRVGNALEVCVTKLTRAQDADGSWNSRGGWAGVLQSAMANSALEMADGLGVEVDREALERSRRYQKDNLDESSGEVRTESAAGVALYSIASNQRATAQEAREVKEKIAQGRRDGA